MKTRCCPFLNCRGCSSWCELYDTKSKCCCLKSMSKNINDLLQFLSSPPVCPPTGTVDHMPVYPLPNRRQGKPPVITFCSIPSKTTAPTNPMTNN